MDEQTVWLSKDSPAEVLGYVWANAGDIVEVKVSDAKKLLRIQHAGFAEAHVPVVDIADDEPVADPDIPLDWDNEPTGNVDRLAEAIETAQPTKRGRRKG